MRDETLMRCEYTRHHSYSRAQLLNARENQLIAAIFVERERESGECDRFARTHRQEGVNAFTRCNGGEAIA